MDSSYVAYRCKKMTTAAMSISLSREDGVGNAGGFDGGSDVVQADDGCAVENGGNRCSNTRRFPRIDGSLLTVV